MNGMDKMFSQRIGARVRALVALVVVAFFAVAGSASAVTQTAVVCVPEKPSQPVLSPDKEGKCLEMSKTKYKEVVIGKEGKEGPPGKEGKEGKEGKPGPEGKPGKEGAPGKEGKEGKEGKQGPEGKEGKGGGSLLSEAEQTTLKEVLPCIGFVPKGIGGAPTVRFSGCNVQIVNGEGTTASTNSEGNLVIGYNELSPNQTGSHNLILGEEDGYASYSGILGGQKNSITGPDGFVLGTDNVVSGEFASIIGGEANIVPGNFSSVSGGESNEAGGTLTWVGGGTANSAKGKHSAVFGGKELTATNEYEAIP